MPRKTEQFLTKLHLFTYFRISSPHLAFIVQAKLLTQTNVNINGNSERKVTPKLTSCVWALYATNWRKTTRNTNLPRQVSSLGVKLPSFCFTRKYQDTFKLESREPFSGGNTLATKLILMKLGSIVWWTVPEFHFCSPVYVWEDLMHRTILPILPVLYPG